MVKNRFIKTVKYLAAFTLAAFLCASVSANTITELRQKREAAAAAAGSATGRLKEVVAEKNTALAEIDALDDELTDVSEELAYLAEQLSLTEAALSETEVALADAIEKRETQYDIFRQRVRSQYINGTVGYLDVILNAQDVIDLLNRVEYVNRIVENDNELVNRLIESENLVAQKLHEITLAKEDIETLTAVSQVKHYELEDAKTRKVALVQRLASDETAYRKQIADLEADSRRIEQMIKDAEAKAAAEAAAAEAAVRRAAQERAAASTATRASELNQGGGMLWPVPGNSYISSQYGNRNSPINGLPEFHTGIDIPARHGDKIVAVEGGVVLSSGWNGGYGNTVIINHGNGITTLYAHNSRNLVKAGQEVTKGQVIAEIGSTGYSTGPHLHFEVRRSGAHVNPSGYVGR